MVSISLHNRILVRTSMFQIYCTNVHNLYKYYTFAYTSYTYTYRQPISYAHKNV